MRRPAEGSVMEESPRQPHERHADHPHHHAGAPARLLALISVIALLMVGLVSGILVLDAVSGTDDGGAAAQATPAPTPTPTATPKPTPTPVPLTAQQRAERKAAADVVKSRGFSVVRLRDYDARKTLRVLLGEQSDGRRLAFFFVNGDYVGNDAPEPSGKVRVARNGDLRVTLDYGIYAPGDPPKRPSGGTTKVRFTWDGTRLAPMDPLPFASQRTPSSQGT
jgi:hypothetical protein